MKALVAGSVLLLLTSACTKPGNFHAENAQMIKIDALPTDFKMPAKIWEIIEKNPDEKPNAEAATPGIFYSSMKVFLTEKNPGILKSPSFAIDLPRGGGIVDLAEYLSGQQGSFYVGFEFPDEFKDGKNLKVIYVSQARKRKIDGRVFGGGCNQYFDITQKFLEMMKTEGIKANTTRERHTTLLAGHYIFSVIKDNQIFISQVTITDSQNKNLLCEVL